MEPGAGSERSSQAGRAETLVSERDLPIADYLALFKDQADLALVERQAEDLARITLRLLRDPQGALCEETLFTPRQGLPWAVRRKLGPAGPGPTQAPKEERP